LQVSAAAAVAAVKTDDGQTSKIPISDRENRRRRQRQTTQEKSVFLMAAGITPSIFSRNVLYFQTELRNDFHNLKATLSTHVNMILVSWHTQGVLQIDVGYTWHC
jgi:hypothetical protein